MKQRFEGWGYVYFIVRADANIMKVGITEHPDRRLRKLGVPETATLHRLIATDNPRRLEKLYHNVLRSRRIPQSEWFVHHGTIPDAASEVEIETFGEVADYALTAEVMITGQRVMDGLVSS